MLWLLLTHPVALMLYYLHVPFWIKLDVKRFTANGSQNSLLRTFHRQRATWRILFSAVVALLASLPAWGTWPMYGISVAALLLLATAYWYYAFNPGLSLARNLPYVGKYHVSWTPDAAFFPDRYIWRRAWRQVRQPEEAAPPAKEDLRVVAVAGPMLKQLLNRIMWAGSLAYSLLMPVGLYFYA
jgi:hypothetical protein